jgi:glutathione S-transferase
MLAIWGRANSVNVQKVLWCCEEIAVKYDRIDAGGEFGVVNTPEYRALNPNGLVPTINDDGFILWESNAIVRYLAAKHSSGNLWPHDLRTRGNADRWMDWMVSTLWPSLRPLFLGIVRTPPEKRDPKALEDARAKTAEILVAAENHLQSHKYVAGEAFTMGDIPLAAGVWRWFALPIERPELPNVARWFELMAERPAFKKVVMTPLT